MEKDNSNKVLLIVGIIAVIIIGICFLFAISMMDFSDKETSDIETTNVVTRNPEQNSTKNIVDENNNQVEDETINEDVAEDIEEPTEEVEESEEVIEEDLEEPQNDVTNPLAELNSMMTGEKIIVSENRITYVTEEEGIKSYLAFDENKIFQGLFVEMVCADEIEADSVGRQLGNMVSYENVTVDGVTVIVNWPVETEENVMMDDMVQHLKNSNQYIIEYE